MGLFLLILLLEFWPMLTFMRWRDRSDRRIGRAAHDEGGGTPDRDDQPPRSTPGGRDGLRGGGARAGVMKESLRVCRFTEHGADPNNPLDPENPGTLSS
jgi:hypothetical protein